MRPAIVLYIASIVFSVSAPAQVTDTILLHFDFNQSALLPKDVITLDSLFGSIKNTFLIRHIQITGHCDSIGSLHYNDSLSQQRVTAVKNYLTNKGMDSSLFSNVTAMGKRSPLNNNSNEIKRALNRRVELIIERSPKPSPNTPAKKDTVTTTKVPPNADISHLMRDTLTKKGTTFTLRDLNFYGNRHILLPGSVHVLEELLLALKENPKIEIEIRGYVCCTPENEDGYDMDAQSPHLSVNRAKAIYDYLVTNGVDKSRLSFKGFGGSYKLYPDEKTEMEQTLNRRVEIKIVKK